VLTIKILHLEKKLVLTVKISQLRLRLRNLNKLSINFCEQKYQELIFIKSINFFLCFFFLLKAVHLRQFQQPVDLLVRVLRHRQTDQTFDRTWVVTRTCQVLPGEPGAVKFKI
jgi:hypothetical protein